MKKRILHSGMLLLSICLVFMTSHAQETMSRIVEDGGTGPFKAVMMADPTLPTHTVFVPQDLSAFGEDHKLPIIAWGNGACFNIILPSSGE